MTPIRLGVNVDHVATVRNARGGTHPDPLIIAQAALAAGANGITIHLREDRRHIQDDDLERMRHKLSGPLNLEMAATSEMVAIAVNARPHACCLVPERRKELTTEGGLDVAGLASSLGQSIRTLREAGIRVSLFIDPDARQVEAAAQLGAAAVELHTGAYANGGEGELGRLMRAAGLAVERGLECHAGHGLTYNNVSPIAALPEIVELNIGHFLIGQAILDGLPQVVRHMLSLMRAARNSQSKSGR